MIKLWYCYLDSNHNPCCHFAWFGINTRPGIPSTHDSLPTTHDLPLRAHSNARNPNPLMRLLHNPLDAPGGGQWHGRNLSRPRSGACALSSPQPKSTRACAPPDPFDTPHLPLAKVPLSPFVTILDAASSISPVFATLTKNTGGGVSPLPTRTRASVPLYPVTVLELDCDLEFDPARAEEDFFPALPPKPAVCLIETRAENAEPFLIRTQDLRRRLQRLLGPADPTSKRLNLRELARSIRYRLTGSALEQIFTYYQHAKHLFPQRYRKLTRLRPPAVLKISLRNAYPRCYVTRRIAVDENGLPTAGAYYGPFPSRKPALAFSEQALDLFKVRRCQIKIRRDPTFPGCIYSEMKMCLAPCFAGCTKEEYDAEVQRLVQFLDTNGNSLRAAIEDDRERASADLDFERAAQLHKRVEKLDDALRFRPELARRIQDLNAVILQRAAGDQSIGVFGIHGGRLAEPFFLRFGEIASQPRSAEHIFKDYLEGNAAAAQNGEKPAATISTTAAREELSEHLALISRWFYSNPRDGEIFFREKDWPYRKILRACSRLLNPKTAEPPTSEPAASGNPSPP
jgi:excinuclease ABC subunit C